MRLGLSGILTRTFINSPLTPLLLLAALIAGALAVFSLPREEEPQISVPMVDILVSANGYKADEAVELVTRPLEDIVKGIDGVEHVYSQTLALSSPRASSLAPTRTPRSCGSMRRSAPTSQIFQKEFQSR
jgi:Cu/Ag efflux pump CusA